MAAYEARLTSAGFLGDLDVAVDGQSVRLRGVRASYRLMLARLIGQWALAIAGIGGLFFGVPGSGWLLLLAPVYSLLLYLRLWWASTESEATVTPGPDTEAQVGAVFRWYDVVWLLNGLTAIALLFTSSSLGRRTVSFRGPGHAAHTTARYLVVASDPAGAIALAARLQGVEGA